MAYPQQAFPRPSKLKCRPTSTPHGPGLPAGSTSPGTYRVLGLNVPARVHSMPTMRREPLCPFRVLPCTGGSVSRHLERHYPFLIAHTGSCAGPTPSHSLRPWPRSVGPCRLLPAPAGNRPFPTLSPQVFPQVPGPLPRWDPMVHSPVSSHRTSAFPWFLKGRLPHKPYSDFTTGVYFGAAVIPSCSGPQVCSPPRSLLPQS